MDDWKPYEEGLTLGLSGAEGGTIMRDDEHVTGARITLERDCPFAPYAITLGIYGWAAHTRFFADEPTALHEFERMKPDLAVILLMIPGLDEPNADVKAGEVADAIAAFVERYP
jgi:hypothetical protein